jgi:hypothetical protein
VRLDHLLSKEIPDHVDDRIRKHRFHKGSIAHSLSVLREESSFKETPNPFGGDGGGEPRVPISNTTVKPSSADGTWTAGSWESRTSPSGQQCLFFLKVAYFLK